VGVLIEFIDDDKGYIAWLAEHPDGCVLNCGRPPAPSYLVIHRAICKTISGTPARGRNWTVTYQKVCGDTFDEVSTWAGQIGPPSDCGICKPG
jgi:hypothetical protein